MQKNIPLARMNTFGVAANAQYFRAIQQPEEMGGIYTWMQETGVPLLIMGEGSNLLFTRDVDRLVLKPDIKTRKVLHEDKEEAILLAGSGLNWDEWVAWCLDHGYYGLENLSLIPGSVGAAPVQNIGAYGFEVGDAIVSVEGFDFRTGEMLVLDHETCHFGYRTSIFKEKLLDTFLITAVIFRLSKRPRVNLTYPQLADAVGNNTGDLTPELIRSMVSKIRREKLPDPAKAGNAGSFFKNPVIPTRHAEMLAKENPGLPLYPVDEELVKIPAGWLIEKCGWKGKRIGPVKVWDTQALVIVNIHHATGEEIREFSEMIREDIRNRFNITLENEVRVI